MALRLRLILRDAPIDIRCVWTWVNARAGVGVGLAIIWSSIRSTFIFFCPEFERFIFLIGYQLIVHYGVSCCCDWHGQWNDAL